MKAEEIRTHLDNGCKVCKVVDPNYNYVGYEVYKGSSSLGTIRRNQFSKLMADTSIKINQPVGSVFVIELYK